MVKTSDTEIFSRSQKSFLLSKKLHAQILFSRIRIKDDILSADEVSAAFDKMTIKLFNDQSFILDKILRVFILVLKKKIFPCRTSRKTKSTKHYPIYR